MKTNDKQIARDLGLPVKSVSIWRTEKLTMPDHYDENGYTPAGIALIRELAGISDGEASPTPPVPAFILLTVLRRLPNPTWVLAKDTEGKMAQLRVRSSLKIAPGMKLQSVRDGAHWKCIHNGFASR